MQAWVVARHVDVVVFGEVAHFEIFGGQVEINFWPVYFGTQVEEKKP